MHPTCNSYKIMGAKRTEYKRWFPGWKVPSKQNFMADHRGLSESRTSPFIFSLVHSLQTRYNIIAIAEYSPHRVL